MFHQLTTIETGKIGIFICMRRLTLFFVLFALLGKAQSPEQPLLPNFSAFSFRSFQGDIQYSEFSIAFPISEKIDLISGGIYNKSPAFERFRIPFGVRYRVNERFGLIGGVYGEWDLYDERYNLNNFGSESNFRSSIFLGTQYGVKPNMLIEAGYEIQLGNQKLTPVGFTPTKNNGVFTLGAKRKF